MVLGNVVGIGSVADKGRVESVADVRLVLDATAAFSHGLYLFDALALLEAVVLEACLDGARFELAQVTPTERHQLQHTSISPSAVAEAERGVWRDTGVRVRDNM